MAATNFQKRLREYNEQLEYAKAAYIKRTGKKIAYGFKDTREYKRIVRNKKQFSYRYTRRRQINEIERRKKDNNWIKSVALTNDEVYHLVLGYSDRISRAIRNAFKLIKNQGRKTGRRVAVDITFPEPENAPENRVYENEVKVDMAFAKMYQQGLERQRQTKNSDSLFITATQTEGSEGFYFIVSGKYGQ